MFEFYSNNLAGWDHADIVKVALTNIRKYIEHNGIEYAFGKGIVSWGSYEGIPGEEQDEP